MKKLDGGKPETPWVLNAVKLYTHMEGSEDSIYYKIMCGNETNSMRNSKGIEKFDIHEPTKTVEPEFI
jgi:hypothetical protein